MTQDPFGNLQEWGSVLELLADLNSAGCLAECQRGLVRILRFKGNWRLREEVLGHLNQIETPTEELIKQVYDIVVDDSNYYEVRILASKVLACLIYNNQKLSCSPFCPKTRSVIEGLEALMKTPHPPVFHDALGHCLRSFAGEVPRHVCYGPERTWS